MTITVCYLMAGCGTMRAHFLNQNAVSGRALLLFMRRNPSVFGKERICFVNARIVLAVNASSARTKAQSIA
jgi:hypothetical protein